MASTFEDALSHAISEMVSISLEYIGGRAEFIYVFALSAGGAKSVDVFYRIVGGFYQLHKVNDAADGLPGHDVSPSRQGALQKFGIKQLKELEQASEEFGQPMPTLIKVVYDVKAGSLTSDLRYDDFYSASNRTPDAFFQDWFDLEAARA